MLSPNGPRFTTLVAAAGCLSFTLVAALVIVMASHNKESCFPSSYSQVMSPKFVRDDNLWSGRSTRKFAEILSDRFDGSLPFHDYWSHFEACRKLNEWNDDEAALVLSVRLKVSALKILYPKLVDCDGRLRDLTIGDLG